MQIKGTMKVDVDSAKKKLEELVNIINSLPVPNKVELHQQGVVKKNIFIIGATGRIAIQPNKIGYDIALSGKSLEKKMSRFMCELCKMECTGYKQTNKRLGKQEVPFWRVDDFNLVRKAAYYYAGLDIWGGETNTLPEEIVSPDRYIEGSSKTILINTYERKPEAREKCIEHFGYQCMACEFDFEKNYGAIGKHYIHVHHIVPLSEIKKEYKLNPIEDLVTVCANCHAMMHRSSPVLLIDQLRELL